MKNQIIYTLIFLLFCGNIFAQNAVVLDETSKKPVEFVSISIVGKSIGTVANEKGEFELKLDNQLDNDSLVFSIVGYETKKVKVSDFKKDNLIYLRENPINLNEVVIFPKNVEEKILGITTKSTKIVVAVEKNQLGAEFGVVMNAKKTARLKKFQLNIANCSYDSIFYRLNVYQFSDKENFENILQKPIYITLTKSSFSDNSIEFDLKEFDILVEGKFLVSIEYVKDFGEGYLNYCCAMGHKTYYRHSSGENWQSVPIGAAISIVADVEK